MIKDIVSYGGKPIITIYHNGFDEEVGSRRIKKSKKVGRYNLTFEEYLVEDLNIPEGWIYKEEGLLGVEDIKNPYGDQACAYMTHYQYKYKPKTLYKLEEDRYNLKIPAELMHIIIAFTKKYTGLDLHKQAMCFGDIFIYECRYRDYAAKGDEGITINVAANDKMINAHFKKQGACVYTRTINLMPGDEEVEVLSDILWDSVDIWIYNDKGLVYYNEDIAFVGTVIMNTSIRGQSKHIPLSKLGEDISLVGEESHGRSVIGKRPDEIRTLLMRSNFSIRQALAALVEKDDAFLFMTPDDFEKARDYIVEFMRNGRDELWIFDPYFSDRESKAVSLDWLRIIAYCKAVNKHIVYKNKGDICNKNGDMCNISEEKASLSVSEFRDMALKDRTIIRSKGKKVNIGITFHQLSLYIHDRFIFTKSKEEVSGIVVGTSLNSLGNYFCIYKLSSGSANEVFHRLKGLMTPDNIVEQGTI